MSDPTFYEKYFKILTASLSLSSKVIVRTQCAWNFKKGKGKVQGVPQSQTVALPRPQEEEETNKSKQAQTEQTYEKH